MWTTRHSFYDSSRSRHISVTGPGPWPWLREPSRFGTRVEERSAEQQREQRLLRVQAVQHDRVRVGELHERLGEPVALEVSQPLRRVLLAPHARPGVGDEDMSTGNRLPRIPNNSK